MRLWCVFVVLAAVAAGACAKDRPKEGVRMFTLSSPAFAQNGPIPKKHAYKGEGQNVSPAIRWEAVPAGTKSLAMICDDPDAPRKDPWVHWVVYRIPASATGLPEGEVGQAVAGVNDFGEQGWGGPMPPKGHGTHHYRFKVYALDTELELPKGRTKVQVEQALKGHVLAEAGLTGTYERK